MTEIKYRKTVTVTKKNLEGISEYRTYMLTTQGTELNFTEAVNQLLRKALETF